jgi:hypothetical protein
MTYEEWKLKLINLIVEEDRVRGNNKWKLDEIKCVLSDDCEYPQRFNIGDTPEEVWQDEIDAIADSQ